MSKQGEKGITWTDATFNPVVGCSKVSDGCRSCWAEKAARLHYHDEFPNGWDGHVKLFPERLEWPLHRRKPMRIAVGLMGDLFHEQVPDEFIEQIFDIMRKSHLHTFQLLTKRPRGVLQYWKWRSEKYLAPNMISVWPENAWLGVSCENQTAADDRIPILLQAPAAIRFVSLEPLLGPIDLRSVKMGCGWNALNCACSGACNHAKLNWVIVGGESGPGARPMQIERAHSIVEQCKPAGVPVHVKQIHLNGKLSKNMDEWPEDLRVREFPNAKDFRK